MSGYFPTEAAEWEPEHYSARWTTANRAPRWWAVVDLAWMLDRQRLPSVREIAATWGWSKSSVHDFVADRIRVHLAWEKREDRHAWLTAQLPRRTNRGHAPPEDRGQPADTRTPENADNQSEVRTDGGHSSDTSRTDGGHYARARLDPSPPATPTAPLIEDSAPASGAGTLTADAHPLPSDEPPPPSDEDYYASEGIEQAEGTRRSWDREIAPDVDGMAGSTGRANDAPVTLERPGQVQAHPTPPAPQRRTAAVDAGGANEGRGPRSGATSDQLAGGGSGVSGDAVRRTGGVVVRGGGVRDLTPGLFGALNGPSSASTGASHATAPAEGVAGKGGASGHVAAWVPTGRAAKGYDPAAIEAMVLHGLAEMRAAPDKAGKRQRATIKPDRCGTDAATILNLWTKLGAPPPEEMAADLAAVAEWAQCSPDPLAARNIRAEGWDAGTNRCRHVKTLCVQEAWGDRLDAAHRWIEKGRPLTLKREEPIKPVAEPGSDQQPFEDFMAYNYRIDREIKRGIRDFKGNVLPTHLRLVANHG